jgi:hypothetical protein
VQPVHARKKPGEEKRSAGGVKNREEAPEVKTLKKV